LTNGNSMIVSQRQCSQYTAKRRDVIVRGAHPHFCDSVAPGPLSRNLLPSFSFTFNSDLNDLLDALSAQL
jgi:hypothetical protein